MSKSNAVSSVNHNYDSVSMTNRFDTLSNREAAIQRNLSMYRKGRENHTISVKKYNTLLLAIDVAIFIVIIAIITINA